MQLMNRRTVLASALAAVAVRASAAPASARQVILGEIPSRLKNFVDRGSIAGAVSLVQQRGEILRLDAIGWRDIASRSPMKTDTIFQIMSQAKPYIATSIMMLQDQGLVDIDQPVERYLPEFAQSWLISSGDDRTRQLRRPSRPITVAQLLSHSSGLPDAAPVTAPFPVKMRYTLAEVTAILSQQPLDAEPGERWRYSNQGIAAAARVVEVVSGMEYPRFVEERIFAPLGMRQSTFQPAKATWPKIAAVYESKENVLREMGPGTPGYGDLKYRRGVRYSMPEAGIFSTAVEAARIHQLFLDRGMWRGHRLLSERAVQLMLTPRLQMNGFGGGHSWQGLGWRLEPGAPTSPASLPAGTFHHSGALGSFGWGDPSSGIVGILLVQRPGATRERDALIQTVNEALAS